MSNAQERRHHPRIEAFKLTYYCCQDQHRKVILQGMGRTLNVSEDGIQLETRDVIDCSYEVFLSLGFKDETVEIQGKVVYSHPITNDKHETGIQFLDVGADAHRLLQQYINAFSARQK